MPSQELHHACHRITKESWKSLVDAKHKISFEPFLLVANTVKPKQNKGYQAQDLYHFVA